MATLAFALHGVNTPRFMPSDVCICDEVTVRPGTTVFSHGFKCQIMRGLSPQLNWTYRELIFFISSKHVDPFLLLQLSSLHIVNIIIKQTTNINAANL